MNKKHTRTKFEGVRRFVRYNWPFYVMGLLCGIAGILLLRCFSFPSPLPILIGVGTGLAWFWLLASVLAAYWVYDASGLYGWEWLQEIFPQSPKSWANIHAGLDESSLRLGEIFPDSRFQVLQIHWQNLPVEASLVRAKKEKILSIPPIPAAFDELPLAEAEMEAVFVIFSAHEIRGLQERIRFLKELGRILSPSGKIIVVEHLRDWKNFIAFGPGLGHFYSLKNWRFVFENAGLKIFREISWTPFVKIFLLQKTIPAERID
ncbi:MAG TPA: methyltransferase [Deltaproteobacteria bacterium]|nr:methyltransferase [Deltaproteobacteria bacterium]